MPWWLLGLSGTASYFDVTGVMWTIAFFYTMGPRFFFLDSMGMGPLGDCLLCGLHGQMAPPDRRDDRG